MEMQSSPIRWFDVRPADLKDVTFEQLSARFRGEVVAALVTHLESLNGAVIILLAPVGSVFCYPVMSEELYFHRDNRIDWGANADRNRAYAQELRRAKIKKADPQARLFGNFDRECGSRGRSVPSLSADMGYLESYRLRSFGFDKSYEVAVRHYLERVFDQLGHWAFVPFPESERVTDFEWKQNSFDYWLLTGQPQSMAFLSDSDAQSANNSRFRD
ncbi:MAG: hypothetical protein ABIG70_00955 [Pseudomonadota bacterium]